MHYLMRLGETVKVVRNDAICIEEIESMNPEVIVISPGPCTPNEARISKTVVEELKGTYPILGICLGHQTIGQVFGGKVIQALEPVHGKVHPVKHDGKGVFKGLKNPLNVTRYHSLIIEKESLPTCLSVTATTEDGQIMGLRHKEYMMEGVQFHPEAILTEQGLELLDNFIQEAKNRKQQ